MAAKGSEWRPGPTVCRCCLTEGCYKDISTEYFWMGKREVYAEMLSDTFNVSIAYSTAGGPNSNSRLICEPCISRLRDASEFKRQVVECERMFMQHLDPGSALADLEVQPEPSVETSVKLERVKLEKTLSDDDFDNRHDFDDDDDDLDDQPLTKLASKVPKKESVDLLDLLDNTKAAEKRKSTSKLKAPSPKKAKKKETLKATSSKSKPEKKKKGDETAIMNIVSATIEKGLETEVVGRTKLKRLSQMDIMRLNATSIIQYTTLCPFKYSGGFLCFYCNQSFKDMAHLKEHTNNVHVDTSISKIREIFVKKAKTLPLKVNVDEYGCKICGDKLGNFDELKNHLVERHNKKIDMDNCGVIPYMIRENEFDCATCGMKFKNYKTLSIHISEHYGNVFCKKCGAGFITAYALRSHLHTHGITEFPCNACDEVFETAHSKSEHKKVHNKVKKIMCNVCNETFTTYLDKQKHKAEAHAKKAREYKCKYCSTVFSKRSQVKPHVKMFHPKPNLFICDICNYQHHRKVYLMNHILSLHGEGKKYKCEVCNKAFAKSSTLAKHMEMYHSKNAFLCHVCSKVYSKLWTFKNHIKSHEAAAENFPCEICNKSYTRPSALRNHIKTHNIDEQSHH